MAESVLGQDEAEARERRRLVIAVALAVVCGAVAAFVSFEPLQIAAALPLTLLLPGYALTAAVFAPGGISRMQRFAMVPALSLAVLALGAVILDHTPGGIQDEPWAILLVAVTVAGCAVAWLRRGDSRPQPRLQRPKVKASELALLIGAVLTVSAAAVIARTPVPAENIVGHTSLSMLHARSDGVRGLRAEVASNERVTVDYRLVFSQRRGPDRLTRRFSLTPGERYTAFAPLSIFLHGSRRRLITARLYRLDEPSHPYRRVNAWIR